MKNNYDDIINLPHHVSTKHPQMSLKARVAQFAPFEALTGHEEAVEETVKIKRENIENSEKNLEFFSSFSYTIIYKATMMIII